MLGNAVKAGVCLVGAAAGQLPSRHHAQHESRVAKDFCCIACGQLHSPAKHLKYPGFVLDAQHATSLSQMLLLPVYPT